MQKNNFIKKMFLLTTTLLGFSSISIASDCKIAVGHHFQPPILYRDDSKQLVGLDKETVELIAKTAGCEVEWIEVPWARALDMVKAGTLMMNTNAIATPVRREFSNMIPYRPDTPNRLFVKKEDLDNKNIKNLKEYMDKHNQNIGTVLGYQYDDEIEALMKDPKYSAKFERISEVEQNINKLMYNRIDGYIMEQLLGNYFIKKQALQDKIVFYDFAFGFDLNRQAFLMISKAADPKGEITDRITKAVDKLKDTEEYKNIIKKYFN